MGGYLILFCVITILAMTSTQMDHSQIQKGIDNMNWSRIYQNISISLDNSKVGYEDNYLFVFAIDFAKKGVDLAGFCYLGIAKLAMQFSLDHPDIINYRVLLWLVILSLIAPIIFPLFTIIVSIFLIIKEWNKNRKEKKEISKLKERRNAR